MPTRSADPWTDIRRPDLAALKLSVTVLTVHQRLELLCRYITRPAMANYRVKTYAAEQVMLKLKNRLAQRHHASGDVAAGLHAAADGAELHAAADGAGAKAKVEAAPDPPWGANTAACKPTQSLGPPSAELFLNLPSFPTQALASHAETALDCVERLLSLRQDRLQSSKNSSS